jgi:asparagine synthase (glutamine-hydrolysing)
MCGIFGLVARDSSEPPTEAALRRMSRTLLHRGPDGGGEHLDGALGFGMRRLSIIDLETGDQPLANEDGSIWIVFNGEIYNYRELAAELAARGHRFRTRSDTEVIVHLYEEMGERCVERLRGMFAFAIWDTSRRTLFLARDRLGIKPLYYAETARGFVFGSELKVLLAAPWVERSVDPGATLAYLRFSYVPDPLTLLRGVFKLPPGHTLTVRGGCAAEPRRYWDCASLFAAAERPGDEVESAEALWRTFRSAVASHLVADVPLGAFLSGGVDSSAVVAAMALESSGPVKTFSVGFEGGVDETGFARRVAEHFGTEHHEVRMKVGDVDVLDEILRGFDEPFADESAIPTFMISRFARQHVKVVLSGDGGDEIFAGYDRYVVHERRRRLGLLGDLGLGGGLRAVSALMPEGTPGKNYLYSLSLPQMPRYLEEIATFPARTLATLLEPTIDASPAALQDILDEPLRRSEGLDTLSRLQYFDMRTYLPGDILTKVDRMSMLASLETRVPMLDPQLVEFACRLPPNLRMRAGETKVLFKRALRSRVPTEVLERPKQGFAVPLQKWFTSDVPSFFHERLASTGRLESIGIRAAGVRELLERFSRMRRDDHCRRLWALLVLDRSLARLSEGVPQ